MRQITIFGLQFSALMLLSSCVGSSAAWAQQGENGQVTELLKVVREPTPPESDIAGRDSLARRQADAAVALLQLGRGDVFGRCCRRVLITAGAPT